MMLEIEASSSSLSCASSKSSQQCKKFEHQFRSMNDEAFRQWQFHFHMEQPNVPDSQALSGAGDISQSNAPSHLAEPEFERLLTKPMPMQSPTFTSSLPSVVDLSFEGNRAQFSHPQVLSNQALPIWDAQHEPFPVQNQSGRTPISKKRSTKTATKKGKKAKAIVELSDDDSGDDVNVMQRWIDPEVIELIAFRSQMDQDFKENAKKQGINIWEKLLAKMVAPCENFTKSAKACRKKWKAIYNQYCNDKRLLQISGEGRKITCRFFDEIDQGFCNAANVRKLCHGDARGNPNPCPPDVNDTADA